MCHLYRVKYLGVLLNASLKDDDDIQRQVTALGGCRQPTIRTILTTRLSLPLSGSSVETEGLVW